MYNAAQRVLGSHHGQDGEGKQQPANMDEEMALEDGNEQRDEAIPQELGGGGSG